MWKEPPKMGAGSVDMAIDIVYHSPMDADASCVGLIPTAQLPFFAAPGRYTAKILAQTRERV